MAEGVVMDITYKQAIEGINQGRVLCIDRKDAPLLPELLEAVARGEIDSELRQIDSQGSVLRFFRKGKP